MSNSNTPNESGFGASLGCRQCSRNCRSTGILDDPVPLVVLEGLVAKLKISGQGRTSSCLSLSKGVIFFGLRDTPFLYHFGFGSDRLCDCLGL